MIEHAIPEPTGGPSMRRRILGRRLRLAGLFGLSVALVSIGYVMAFYLTTRRPVTDLPGVQQVTRPIPPRRLFSFVQVASPLGVALSPDGQRIYVSEGGGDRLVKAFDREGRLVGQAAPPATKPGSRKPGLLSVDGTGRVYVSDRLRSAVDLYTPTLEWESAWIPRFLSSYGPWLPNGVTVGSDGRLFVTDVGSSDHAVLVVERDGSLLDVLGKVSGVPGGLNYPVQAASDEAGRIYISDASNGRVLVVGSSGVNMLGLAGEEAVSLPIGLAVGGEKLFVADAAAHRIAVYAIGDRPEFLYSFGDSDDDEGLAYPHAVALDRTGRIYVADRANHRVQVWTY